IDGGRLAAKRLVEDGDVEILGDLRPVGHLERDVLVIVEHGAAMRHGLVLSNDGWIYSAVTVARRMAAVHRLASAAMKAAASGGDSVPGCMPSGRSLAAISSERNTSRMVSLSFDTIAGGVLGGAEMAFQVSDSKSLTPDSAMVGMSGAS